MTHSREVVPSPPVTFPVYGLDQSWPGSRWLDSFGDGIGHEVRWMRLAHQNLDSGSLIMVETWSRPLTDSAAARTGEPALQSVAFSASVVLVNLTLPAQPAARPPGILRALVNNAYARSGEYEQWSPASWEVDGSEVTARVWRFADGWAAFTDGADGVYLAAAGAGTGPEGLALAPLKNGHPYHLDLDAPLHPGAVAASSAARAGGERPFPPRADWHADQVRLMRALACDRRAKTSRRACLPIPKLAPCPQP